MTLNFSGMTHIHTPSRRKPGIYSVPLYIDVHIMGKVTADPQLFYDNLKDRAYTYEDSPYQDLQQVMMLERETAPTLQPLYDAFCKALSDAVVLAGYTYRTLPSEYAASTRGFLRTGLLHPATGCQNVGIERVFQKDLPLGGCLRIRSIGQLSEYSCNNTCAITRIIY